MTNFTDTNASDITVSGNALPVAVGDFGPLLVYYPTIPNLPVPRFGEIIMYSNENAFVDGQFENNSRLFLNIANSAVGQPVPVPAILLLMGLGLACVGCARQLKAVS